MHPIIALWTHPRSRSTAFERVMMERGDVTILHEPFSYLYYVHEGKATIAQEYVDPHHPRTYPDIRDHILALAHQSPVFFKDMGSHCCTDLRQDDAFLQRLTNTFLIREPSHAITSFYALNPHVRLDEIGYEPLCDIFDHVVRLTRRVPVVINADDLVENPHRLIEAYCAAVGLAFLPEALHWDAGHKPAWDIWKQWHLDVAQSTHIAPRLKTYDMTIANNAQLKAYYEYYVPYYEAMNQHRLRL